jgi:hypothetical protein
VFAADLEAVELPMPSRSIAHPSHSALVCFSRPRSNSIAWELQAESHVTGGGAVSPEAAVGQWATDQADVVVPGALLAAEAHEPEVHHSEADPSQGARRRLPGQDRMQEGITVLWNCTLGQLRRAG